MIFLFFCGFWLISTMIFFPFGGGVLLSTVGVTTLAFTLSTLLCSLFLSLSVTFIESIKSSMLSTIFIGMAIIFSMQVLAKNAPFLAGALFYPVFFMAIYLAVKTTTPVSSKGALVISTANIFSLYFAAKITGFALAKVYHA